MERSVKQVIVIRRDLHMRRGKEIAQGAHAAMAFLTRRLNRSAHAADGVNYISAGIFSPAERDWMENSFRKVVLKVNSEEELLDVAARAREAGLHVEEIRDSGATEVPPDTLTAIGIGPDFSENIDKVTEDLIPY